ncbi:uncharacterized protein LOC134202403 [Armigeres subalbatus]|uniref:uncharacterized protein LOC134202403 n=1 Tax=Armigeres subalbatus TaxID=124917 RepID=UPI002ED43EE9
MKQTVILFVIGCTVLGPAAFAGGQSAANGGGDPAPGRSPGPPGVMELSNTEHGEPLPGESPTYIVTKDDTGAGEGENRSPLTSNDVLDSPPDEDQVHAGGAGDVEQSVGDVSSESSGSSALATSGESGGEQIQNENQPAEDGGSDGDGDGGQPPTVGVGPCSRNIEDYLKPDDKIVRVDKDKDDGGTHLQVHVVHDVFDTANGIVPGVVYRGT